MKLSLLGYVYLFSFVCFGFGAEITVGTTRLTIPAPEGYVLITDDMQPYAAAAKRFVPPSNQQFALFLSEADAAVARRGEIPASGRQFYVQSEKQLVDRFLTASDFADLKREIKTQNAATMKQVEAQMPGFMERINKGISKDFNVDMKLSLNQMVPLPPHAETEHSYAFSMIVSGSTTDEKGMPVSFEGFVTGTFVYVRGKVLFLYANAEKSALEWSRTASQKWADAIIAANPSTGETAAQEKRVRRTGFDWNQVMIKALIGAVIGGLIGGISYFFRKKKA